MDERNMDTHAHIIALIQELRGDLQRIAEKQDEMNEDVKKIKEAVYNPDSGLYARLRDLEQWKETYSKSYLGCSYYCSGSSYSNNI